MKQLINLVMQIARLTKDEELVDGKAFVLENDDAVDTLHALINSARNLIDDLQSRTLYAVIHEHGCGTTSYLVASDHFPEEDELVEALDINFEPLKGEVITSADISYDEVQILGTKPATKNLTPAVRLEKLANIAIRTAPHAPGCTPIPGRPCSCWKAEFRKVLEQ
jgi:hypothetical protein